MKPIIDALTVLPHLQELRLISKKITSSDIKYLCKTWRANNFKINKLHIGGKEKPTYYTPQSGKGLFTSIASLVDSNQFLKQLNLKFEVSEYQVGVMKQVLFNPERCMLQELHIKHLVGYAGYRMQEILQTNKNIVTFTADENSKLFDADLAKNRNKKFIATAIEVCNAYNAEPIKGERNHLSSLPDVVMLIILRHLGKGIFGMSDENVLLWHALYGEF